MSKDLTFYMYMQLRSIMYKILIEDYFDIILTY